MPQVLVGGRRLGYEARPEDLDLSALTVVFVHGSGGDRNDWRAQLNALADRVNMVAVELPGHGASDPPGESSVAAYARSVTDLVEHIGLKRVFLVGNSLGSAITLHIALTPPQWLAAIGLVGSGARLKVMPSILEGLRKQPESTLAQFSGFAVSEHAGDTVKNKVEERFRNASPEIVLGDLSACNDFDVIARLSEIDLPTWIIVGAEDRLTPVKYSQFLHEKIAGSALVVVDGAGHLVMEEKPEEFNRSLVEFVESLTG